MGRGALAAGVASLRIKLWALVFLCLFSPKAWRKAECDAFLLFQGSGTSDQGLAEIRASFPYPPGEKLRAPGWPSVHLPFAPPTVNSQPLLQTGSLVRCEVLVVFFARDGALAAGARASSGRGLVIRWGGDPRRGIRTSGLPLGTFTFASGPRLFRPLGEQLP